MLIFRTASLATKSLYVTVQDRNDRFLPIFGRVSVQLRARPLRHTIFTQCDQPQNRMKIHMTHFLRLTWFQQESLFATHPCAAFFRHGFCFQVGVGWFYWITTRPNHKMRVIIVIFWIFQESFSSFSTSRSSYTISSLIAVEYFRNSLCITYRCYVPFTVRTSSIIWDTLLLSDRYSNNKVSSPVMMELLAWAISWEEHYVSDVSVGKRIYRCTSKKPFQIRQLWEWSSRH